MSALSAYEQRALEQVQDRKNKLTVRAPRALTTKARAGGSALAQRASRVPGFTKAQAMASKGYTTAAAGVGRALTNTSRLTLSEKRVLRRYRRRDVPVTRLSDIRHLDLEQVERQGRPQYLSHVYAGLAATEGAAAGVVITGGEVVASVGSVVGAGAGSAPGLGTISGAMAFDAATVLALASRVVGHHAMIYGYDPRDPGEAVYALGVVNLGSAVTSSGKYAAYAELSRLTQALARSASWATLNRSVLPRIMARFARVFGVRLTKSRLGMAVPVAGIVTGAGLNYWLLDQVSEEAYWTYRERFLNDKQGITGMCLPPTPAPAMDGSDDDAIDIVAIVEDALAEEEADGVGTVGSVQDGVPEVRAARGDDTARSQPAV